MLFRLNHIIIIDLRSRPRALRSHARSRQVNACGGGSFRNSLTYRGAMRVFAIRAYPFGYWSTTAAWASRMPSFFRDTLSLTCADLEAVWDYAAAYSQETDSAIQENQNGE